MSTDQPNYDELDEDDLYHAVVRADWNIGNTGITSYGVTLLFRKHYTAHVGYPGVETRTVSGTDRADAMRRFLKELDEQREG